MLRYRLLGPSGLRISELCLGNESRGRTNEKSLAIARAVDEVADELGVTSAKVATAWVQAQGYGMIPIVGARKVEQITDTIGAAEVKLTDAHLAKLDAVSKIELGFPHDFLKADQVLDLVRSEARTRIDGR